MNTSKEMARIAYNALNDKKAIDIRLLDISEVTVIADYFIIAHGSNVNQIQTMADNVEDELHKIGFRPKQVEGYQNANWILLDYGNIIVHLFTEEDRLFYNLERIWKDGKTLEVTEI